jgi:Amylo-alpha-1,6-glucosidase
MDAKVDDWLVTPRRGKPVEIQALWCTWLATAKAAWRKGAIISAVPPLMLKTPANPLGQPEQFFDDFQAQLAANRSQFYYDVAAEPFYGYNRPGANPLRQSS